MLNSDVLPTSGVVCTHEDIEYTSGSSSEDDGTPSNMDRHNVRSFVYSSPGGWCSEGQMLNRLVVLFVYYASLLLITGILSLWSMFPAEICWSWLRKTIGYLNRAEACMLFCWQDKQFLQPSVQAQNG